MPTERINFADGENNHWMSGGDVVFTGTRDPDGVGVRISISEADWDRLLAEADGNVAAARIRLSRMSHSPWETSSENWQGARVRYGNPDAY